MIVVIAIIIAIIAVGAFLYFNSGMIFAKVQEHEEPTNLQIARQVHDDINKERTIVGLKPLAWNEDAAAKAELWAKHLRETNTLEHSNTYCAGENVLDTGLNSMKPEDIVSSFMNSHEHRDNIRNPVYTSEGIGVAGTFVVENFC